jgi:hypothetical protein
VKAQRHVAAALLLGLLAPAGLAIPVQKLRFKDKPPNDPTQCPYCLGEPELMQASGVVSHGGFDFGQTDTAGIDALLATSDIRWIETAHHELGIARGTYKVSLEERDKIRTECTALAQVLPEVPLKPTRLYPWLSAHLYAVRMEQIWQDMLELLQVEESAFPDGNRPWDLTGTYMGEGPYLGQKGKYETLILPSEAASQIFLKDQYGLQTKLTQRYHNVERGSLNITIHIMQEGLRDDGALHGHLAFNLSQNFVDGYKHYSYDTPVWIREGISHMFERRVNPDFNSFDSAEGSAAQVTRKSNWEPPVVKLVKSGEAPRMAELMTMRNFGDLDQARHFTTWSMMEYLDQVHPDFLAKLLGGIKGLTDARGFADGSNLDTVHRNLFKDQLGMSYRDFDQAWAEWVLANYSSQ